MAHRIRVWDLPTRLFHWLLALCVVGLVVTGKVGGAAMDWHARLGYAVLALLLFRLAWGFIGGHWSRFATFLYAPRSVGAYLAGRGHPDHLVGHNPLGAGSGDMRSSGCLSRRCTRCTCRRRSARAGRRQRSIASSAG